MSARSLPPRPRARRTKKILSSAIAVLLGLAFSMAGVTAAHAAVAVGVSIQTVGATTQPSGAAFAYQINLACAGTNAPTCKDAVVTIPLNSVAGMETWLYDVTGGPAGFIQSSVIDPAGPSLIVTLAASIPAGSSQSIMLSVTPPNLTTPNGTTWSFLPSVASTDPDMTGTTAPVPASGIATATVPLTVGKSSDRTFYEAGDTINYTLRATCPVSKPLGSVYSSSMTITDALPAGLTFVSSSPVESSYDPATRLLTWVYPDASSVPVACGGTAPAAASDTITVQATVGTVGGVGADFVTYQNVENVVDVSATPVGPGDPATATGRRTVVMLGAGDPPVPGTNSLGKSPSGPLNRSTTSTPSFTATYPGRWLPNGDNSARPASVLDAAPATYTITPRIQYDSFQYEITDKMPCLADRSTLGVYTQSAGVCAAPAFHTLGVRIDFSGTAPGAGYVPRYVDLAGVEHDMNFETSGGSWRGWVIPTGAIGGVSGIIIPRDTSQESRLADNIRVYGYADATVDDGEILQNRASVDWFLRSDLTAIASASSGPADIHILNAAQIGIAKTMTNIGAATGSQSRMQLTATLLTPGAPAEDLVVADLLPVGTSLATAVGSITAQLQRSGGPTIPLAASDLVVQLIPGHEPGRDLLRITLPTAKFPPAEAGRFTFVVSPLVVNKPLQPGVYTNTARVFYDSSALVPSCVAGSYDTTDPNTVAVTGAGSDNCLANAVFRTVTSSSGQFQLGKTVQGDYDTSPQTFPAVGHVKLSSGAANYALNWRNTGAPTLESVVLYDVFPHVGDFGVSGAQSGAPRGSQFQPILASVDAAPAGLTVSYSASANACRPEVYPSQGACVNDWTTDPTTLGGLGQVLALRLVSSGQYLTGEGFSLGFTMSVPTVSKDMIAWNSVAAYARTAGGSALLPTESPRVGITASEDLLSLGKTVDFAAATPGDLLTYRITVANIGTNTSVATQLTDVLPDGLDFVSADTGGVYDAATRTITWAVPALPRDSSAVLTVVARVGTVQRVAQIVNEARLVNPPGFSPLVVVTPCVTGPGACATTSVPVTPTVLGFTGSTWATAGWVAGGLLLAVGAALGVVSGVSRRTS